MTRKRRSLAIAASVMIHAALLFVLLRATPAFPPTASDAGAIGVSLVDGKALFAPARPKVRRPHPESTRSAHPKPPRPDPPPDVSFQFVKTEPPADKARLASDPATDVVAVSVADAASAASGKTCEIGAWLQAALQADPVVQAALARVPRSAKSVANAIMIWDVRWVRQPPSALDGVSAIRAALMIGVRSAPPACQSQMVRGPELMPLTDASGTTILAVGSGEWRWADLLRDEAPGALIESAQGR
jgi:hypothetical protein